MKLFEKHRKIILLFLFISLSLYIIYYLTFHKWDVIIESFFLNLAFLPIYVLFTTFILEELLAIREKPLLYRKRNAAIGLFYSEIGTTLMKELSLLNNHTAMFSSGLMISENWNRQSFLQAKTLPENFDFELAEHDFGSLLSFLNSRSDFILSVMQNPILTEDQSFNHLILSIFHLLQELRQRTAIGLLKKEDYNHLTVDIKRVYASLIIEWLNYMEHISLNYPHLFSLEVRTNPFRAFSDRT
ncbi:MAG: hypothetical protein AWM53_01918 [Candidatus Dichloromethanomonas elyunquensis]|nr:MAG: hypothetical protein AWM53_01918 [Candidatus Dichloromethanomonas elyunquensis]